MFEKFRNGSIKNCGLCQGHYLSAAALSWYPMLNRTKVELEFIYDAEKGMRGGVS